VPEKKKKKGPPKFVRDVMRVLGGQVVMTGMGMLTGIITARWLGPTDRGLFNLLILLPTVLSNFVKLGIPQASVYYMRRKNVSASEVASNSLWFALTMGSALAIVCWFGRDWLLAKVLKEAPESLIPPTLILIPCVLLQFYFLGVAQAQERFGEYNVRQIVPNLLSLIGMFVVLVVLRRGLVAAVLAQTAITIFMSVWMTVRVHRDAPITLRVNPALLRDMLGFGVKSYVQTLAATLHLRIDQFVLAYVCSPTDVGYYGIGVTIVGLLLKVSEASGTVMFPRLAAQDRAKAWVATTRVVRHTLFITGLGVLALWVVGPIGIPLLYGHKFDRAIMPMVILLPGALMMSLYQLLTRTFTSDAKQEINIFAAVSALILNVALNFLFDPKMGASGAALANGISYGTAAMILLVAFVRESGLGVRETLLVGSDDIRDLVRAARRIAGRVPGLATSAPDA
jgi:O-antigen/teichoic acid export membrane protein